MTNDTITTLRETVNSYIGHNVKVRINKGRKRFVVNKGVLEGAYPSVFVVRITNDRGLNRALSHSYIDLLTGFVEMTLCDDSETKIS